MKILVTGCNGYIGSHVVKLLAEKGHTVTGWDINIHGEYNNVENYLHKQELVDVTGKLPNKTYDAVVHLAGRSIVPVSLKEPTEYYRVNVMGTANMLDNIDTEHFLFASTTSAWEIAARRN